jgi:peroxiredoxin
MRLTSSDKSYLLPLRRWLAVPLLFLVLPVVVAGAVAENQSDTPQPAESAESLLVQRHYKQAIKAFERDNARQGGKSAECYWGIALANWGLGNIERAEDACTEALRYAGANVRLQVMAHNLKAMAAQKLGAAGDQGQLEEAEKEYVAAYALEEGYPGRPAILFNLGVTQLQAGKTQEGIATLKSYLAAAPRSSMALAARQMIAHPFLAAREPEPDFSVTTLDGHTLTLSDLSGKIVLLDFWGAWCPQCRRSSPILATLWKKFSVQAFVILSVSSDRDTAAWHSFIEQHKMDWPQYLDSNYTMQRLYGVDTFPDFILIDQNGFLLYRSSGFGPSLQPQLDAVISTALQNIRLEQEVGRLRKELDANRPPQTRNQGVGAQ